MKSTPFQSFFTAPALIDLALITMGEVPVLVTIEPAQPNTQAQPGLPSASAMWRFWTPDPHLEKVQPLAQCLVQQPMAGAADLAILQDQIWALLQNDDAQPAFLMRWQITSPSLERITLERLSIFRVEMASSELKQLNLPARDLWSTRSLPPLKWLFHPSLAVIAGAPARVAFNTVDSHAIIWECDDSGQPARVSAFIPSHLEPSWHRCGGRNLLFFRQPPPDWYVYSRDYRYGGQEGPLALPLGLCELDADGKPGPIADLSKMLDLGDVFDYHACAAGEKEMAVAVVGGSVSAPLLKVLHSEDAGRSFQVKSSDPLPQVPRRVRITASKTGFVIGTVCFRTTGYIAACMKLEN